MSFKVLNSDKKLQAYIIGIALGDGNLSNPNKRAVRLRISCDTHYPLLIKYIIKSLKLLLPRNKIGIVGRKSTCVDISIYSNSLPKLLGWKWNAGPKDKQNVRVPAWIKTKPKYTKECLRGLFQTDGCIYKDRGYAMVSFVNTSSNLAYDAFKMMNGLDYHPHMQEFKQKNGKIKYTVRLSKNTLKFIEEINLWKK